MPSGDDRAWGGASASDELPICCDQAAQVVVLISTPSQRPIRWFVPPQRTAYFQENPPAGAASCGVENFRFVLAVSGDELACQRR